MVMIRRACTPLSYHSARFDEGRALRDNWHERKATQDVTFS